MEDERVISTLGNGNWPWEHIPERWRAPSIMRKSICCNGGIFSPKLLFDGTLER